jgi:excisionase family DNA binding protein
MSTADHVTLATAPAVDTASGGATPVVRATYTISEVCSLLGISRATAYTMLRAGEIPARRLGSRWIIPRHRLDTWLNAEPAAEPTSTWAVGQ